MNKRDTISLLLVLGFAATNCVWVFAIPLLPFVDLPFHLAEAVVFKNFGNPEYLFSTYFSIPTMIKSNSLYIFFCASGIFPDAETGNRVFYSIYIFLMPFSLWLLIKTLKGNTMYSLLSFLFLINHNVHWGFVSYMMSLPVILLIYNSFYYYFVRKKHYLAYFLWLSPVLVFALHFQMAIFTLLVFGVLTLIYQRREPLRIIINILSAMPALAIMYYAYMIDSKEVSTPLFSYMLNYYTSGYFATFIQRFNVLFVVDNYFILRNIPGVIYSLAITVPIALIFIIKVKKTGIKELFKENTTGYLFILFLLTAMCFFLLPDVIPGQNIIFERYSVPLFLLAIVIISTIQTENKRRYLLNIIIPVIIAIHTTFIFDYMFDFRKATADFTEDIFPAESHARLAGVISDNDFRGSKVYAHFPMYFTVWKKGITTGLIDYRFGLIKRNVSRDVLPQYIEWTEKEMNYDEYYKPVDYLLERSASVKEYTNFRFLRESGMWKIYSKK